MSADRTPLDVAIVGAGAAGTSAALWARTYDLRFRWLDRTGRAGGILERVENPIDNYPGRSTPDGAVLARSLRRQLGRSELDGPEAHEVVRAERESSGVWALQLANDSTFRARSLLLATGTSYRRLGVPGELEGLGEYVSQSTARDADRFADRTVAVVGGGDAGFEGALQLAERDCRVHMLLRSDEFRARPQFVEPARSHPEIHLQPIPTTVERIEPARNRDGCLLHLETRGKARAAEVACLFVRIGVDPVYPELRPTPETDDEGYLRVDRHQTTSVPGLLAAGDVTDTPLPAVATAVGDGATALHSAADHCGLA